MFKLLRNVLMSVMTDEGIKQITVPVGHQIGPGRKSVFSKRHQRACANRRVFVHPTLVQKPQRRTDSIEW